MDDMTAPSGSIRQDTAEAAHACRENLRRFRGGSQILTGAMADLRVRNCSSRISYSPEPMDVIGHSDSWMYTRMCKIVTDSTAMWNLEPPMSRYLNMCGVRSPDPVPLNFLHHMAIRCACGM